MSHKSLPPPKVARRAYCRPHYTPMGLRSVSRHGHRGEAEWPDQRRVFRISVEIRGLEAVKKSINQFFAVDQKCIPIRKERLSSNLNAKFLRGIICRVVKVDFFTASSPIFPNSSSYAIVSLGCDHLSH